MASLCARSEQCTHDIIRKLRNLGLPPDERAEVMDELRERGFLDDSRYARAFARDKVRFSGWGRMKIRGALAAKGIGGKAADAALAAIEPADYADALSRAARAKARQIDLSTREGRVKLFRHLISRGFEYDAAMEGVKNELRK